MMTPFSRVLAFSVVTPTIAARTASTTSTPLLPTPPKAVVRVQSLDLALPG